METATLSDTVTGRGIVLYDGMCPLCQRSVRILKRLDWLGRLHFQDARDMANLPVSAVPLDPIRMMEEMHLLTPDRQHVFAGYRAFRWMAWRLPITWPIVPLLYLPGAAWLGNKIYLWVARNRYSLVPCKDGVCHIPLRGKGQSSH